MAQAAPVPAVLSLLIARDLAQLVPLADQYWKIYVHEGDWA